MAGLGGPWGMEGWGPLGWWRDRQTLLDGGVMKGSGWVESVLLKANTGVQGAGSQVGVLL